MYRTPSGVFCVILETEYEKEEYYEPRYLEGDNLIFNPKYIRNIYTLTGIVKPVVFYKRRFVATWKRDKGTMLLDIFEDISQQEKKELEDYRQMYEEVLKQ